MRAFALVLLLPGVTFGCGGGAAGGADAAADAPDAGGVPGEIVVATWNLGLYPHSVDAPAHIGATFDALAIDVLAVQEVEDAGALADLAAAHGAVAVLDPPAAAGTGPLLGVVWRPARVDVTQVETRFVGDPSFPRPAVRATVTRPGGAESLELLIVHLKAGVDPADEQLRLDAVAKLDALIETELGGQDVLVLGDFNEAAEDPRAYEVFAPFLMDSAPYAFLTWSLATSGAITFLPAGIMLDHMVLMPLPGAVPELSIPPLDQEIADYQTTVSDHLPVVIHLPLP